MRLVDPNKTTEPPPGDEVKHKGVTDSLAEDDLAGEPDPDPAARRAREDDPPSGGSHEPPQAVKPVLSISFDVTLTAEDLAKLSPEQIRALYEAVGNVAAIKAQEA